MPVVWSSIPHILSTSSSLLWFYPTQLSISNPGKRILIWNKGSVPVGNNGSQYKGQRQHVSPRRFLGRFPWQLPASANITPLPGSTSLLLSTMPNVFRSCSFPGLRRIIWGSPNARIINVQQQAWQSQTSQPDWKQRKTPQLHNRINSQSVTHVMKSVLIFPLCTHRPQD